MRQLRWVLGFNRKLLIIFDWFFIDSLINHFTRILMSLLDRLSKLDALKDRLLVTGTVLLGLVVSAYHS